MPLGFDFSQGGGTYILLNTSEVSALACTSCHYLRFAFLHLEGEPHFKALGDRNYKKEALITGMEPLKKRAQFAILLICFGVFGAIRDSS